MRRRALVAAAMSAVLAAVLMAVDLNPAVPQTTSLTALRSPEDPGLDPEAGAWDDAQEVALPLTAQEVTYPFGGGSIAEVRVRALSHDRKLYLRVVWNDSSRNATSDAVDRFTDSVAVEFPADAKATVPSVCMGQADGGVNVWQWRADHQSTGSSALADAYPVDESLPARELGNPIAQRSRAAQDLVARGFGTLAKAPTQSVRAHGVYSKGDEQDAATWAVVFERPFAKPGRGQPAFSISDELDVAFAVWDGRQAERNGIKSVSQFGRLVLSSASQPDTPWSGWWLVLLPLVALMIAALWRVSRWLGSAPKAKAKVT